MLFTNDAVVEFPGRIYGYNFAYMKEPQRTRFFAAFKDAVPLKMWDAGSKRWWVPDIYCGIAESLASEHRALSPGVLSQVAGHRSKYINGPFDISDDFKTLGLQPDAPLRIAEMAAYHWRTVCAANSSMALEGTLKEDAWLRIKTHFDTAAARAVCLNTSVEST